MTLSSCESKYFTHSQTVFSSSGIPFSTMLKGKNESEAFNKMLETLEALDKEISLTRTDSTLYYFNESADVDEKVQISENTYKMLQIAKEVELKSNGAFSIAAYNLSVLWRVDANGFKNSPEGEKFSPFFSDPLTFALPTLNEVKNVLSYSSTSLLTIYDNSSDGNYYISKSDKRLKIDLGAIAKGYAVDLCYEILLEYEVQSGLIDLSGNIYLYNVPDKSYFGIRAPRPRAAFLERANVCAIEIAESISVVTSGDYERYYEHSSGLFVCHIIDPRSGLPVGIEYAGDEDGEQNIYSMKDAWLSSATIILSSSAYADAYSTATFVLGFDEGGQFLKSNSVRAVLFLDTYNEDAERKMAQIGEMSFVETETINGYKDYISVSL